MDDLVTTLRAGQLPADIELEWNNTVGAQLGEDSIRAGIRASLVGLVVVVAFMAIYYLVGGAIADFAVLVNLLLVLGGMAGMQSVLTLPGIAGLVLTLGMAVDANVLINERIREEGQRGKTMRLAIRTGYERAFLVILDTHLTTIITALILFGVGTGPVRGFAITLILGLVLSLFTSFWVTRWLLDIVRGEGLAHEAAHAAPLRPAEHSVFEVPLHLHRRHGDLRHRRADGLPGAVEQRMRYGIQPAGSGRKWS